MRRRLTAGLVAAVATVAMAVPATGLANAGGIPHKSPTTCPAHSNKGQHKGQTKNATKGKRLGRNKGRKCG